MLDITKMLKLILSGKSVKSLSPKDSDFLKTFDESFGNVEISFSDSHRIHRKNSKIYIESRGLSVLFSTIKNLRTQLLNLQCDNYSEVIIRSNR